MGWLSQILLGHGGHGGGFGGLGGHGGHGGSGGHGGHGGYDERPASSPTPSAPEAAIDPVSRDAVRTAQALTSLYQGKVYYFASKENRDRFEAAPQEYAQNASGHPMAAPQPPQQESYRRRGGC